MTSLNSGNSEFADIMDSGPSRAFAETLKTFADVPFGVNNELREAVVVFNADLFIAKCTPSSPTFNESLNMFDEMASVLFVVDETWANRELLYLAVKTLADRQGWTPKKTKKYINCNRYGVPTEEEEGEKTESMSGVI